MISRIRTGLILLMLAFVIWLFAESESLGDAEQAVRVEFGVGSEDRDRLLVRTPDFDGRLQVSFRGAQASIQRARAAMESILRLEPGMPGIPDTDGRHTLRLIDVLREQPFMRTTGVTIELVQPQQITIEVEELVQRDFPIVPLLPGIEVEGEVSITPATAQVRLPRSAAAAISQETAVIARVTPAAGRTLPPGPHTMGNIALALPDELANARGVTLLTRRATLEFTVRSTLQTETFSSVPVQVLLPPIEMSDWRVILDESDQFVRVEISGPSELIERLRSGQLRLLAAFSLSDVELASGVTSKPLRIMVLADGVPAPLPEGLTVTSPVGTARFVVQRIAP